MYQNFFWNFWAIFGNNLRVKTQLSFFTLFFQALVLAAGSVIGQNLVSVRSANTHVSSPKKFRSHISNIDNNLRGPWGGGNPRFPSLQILIAISFHSTQSVSLQVKKMCFLKKLIIRGLRKQCFYPKLSKNCPHPNNCPSWKQEDFCSRGRNYLTPGNQNYF